MMPSYCDCDTCTTLHPVLTRLLPPEGWMRAGDHWRQQPRVESGKGGGRWTKSPASAVADAVKALESAATADDRREAVARLTKPQLVELGDRLGRPVADRRALKADLIEHVIGERQQRPSRSQRDAAFRARAERQQRIDHAASVAEMATEVERDAHNLDMPEESRRVLVEHARTRAAEHGLEPIGAVGQQVPYNPEHHDLVGGSVEPGREVEVTAPGYRLNDRTGEQILMHRATVADLSPPPATPAPPRTAEISLYRPMGSRMPELLPFEGSDEYGFGPKIPSGKYKPSKSGRTGTKTFRVPDGIYIARGGENTRADSYWVVENGQAREVSFEEAEQAAIRPARSADNLLDGYARAAGHDTTPGHDELRHYWTETPEGLAKWAESPKPWTTLDALLAEHIPDTGKRHRIVSAWVHRVTGHWTGEDAYRVAHGGKPRGNRIGPG